MHIFVFCHNCLYNSKVKPFILFNKFYIILIIYGIDIFDYERLHFMWITLITSWITMISALIYTQKTWITYYFSFFPINANVYSESTFLFYGNIFCHILCFYKKNIKRMFTEKRRIVLIIWQLYHMMAFQHHPRRVNIQYIIPNTQLVNTPYNITGPAIVNILHPIPYTWPSFLNSIAGDATELANPVIGTITPAPANFAILANNPKPVSNALIKTSVSVSYKAAVSFSDRKSVV